ncbi:MAG TPA: SCP2 sterol-binding domain-containing protein [Candidatus Melainabacteria bacterium]|nr:SCP2 sterol-binding domain-containing protein [Candidatus Melainabacteria bacterium]
MPYFTNTDELYTVMDRLWTYIKSEEEICGKLLGSKLVVRFKYKDPDGVITIDGSDGQELRFHFGDCEIEPDVEMTMKSDVAHNFWLGKEPPAVALLQGRIVSKGPVHKALALLPVIKPTFKIYPSIYEENSSKSA